MQSISGHSPSNHSPMSLSRDDMIFATDCLDKVASRVDNMVNHALRWFAQSRWSDSRFLGLIPMHHFRIRKQRQANSYIWWVEHDIPPYDIFRCEAYIVELSLGGLDQPKMVVRSGVTGYLVFPMTMDEMKGKLVLAGADAPILTNRQFGPALDP